MLEMMTFSQSENTELGIYSKCAACVHRIYDFRVRPCKVMHWMDTTTNAGEKLISSVFTCVWSIIKTKTGQKRRWRLA